MRICARVQNMADYQNILDTYQRASVKSGEMLEAAKTSDWDRLVDLEHECKTLIDKLHHIDTDANAPPRELGYRRRKNQLLRKVLADDAEIRRYTEPWMNQLQVYLGSAHQEQRLQRAYQSA